MIVLIPAYEPGAALVELVARLRRHTVLVVDDGSGPRYVPVFAAARAAGAEVMTMPFNQGKGRALRAGFEHARRHHPGEPVVCADSDGQHRPDDIEAVAARLADGDPEMVLGARRFMGEVPGRSRIGNRVTRAAFRATTGLPLTDTQTGLRAYPARMLPWLEEVKGDRFEYELRLLVRAAREQLEVAEVEIATVYLDHNASSHFRPVRDSLRVLAPLLAFAASSLLGFIVDTVTLLALVALTGSLMASAVGARMLSAAVNYSVNRRFVFATGNRGSVVRYVGLAAVLLATNVVLLESLSAVTGSLLLAKVATELVLLAASFVVQRSFVFHRRLRRPAQPDPLPRAAVTQPVPAR
ncbi:GtrA-like protein [Friedmanniella luteola]|uniref:GtrA-like protein n=1 Tax=Friedmanniella luteola TaxID=546871 RepID=A0A1H1LAB1_9ACTN|nr:bifunctional glycosyltransferase family 2/GtrA family protein [Friedmanniella luteola]SDR71423.1 GtrA-like protein [Friedmanniella luteola]